MTNITDSRSRSGNSSVVNRERFLQRAKKQIGEAVRKSIAERKITDIEDGAEISISPHDISEPEFGFGSGGRRDLVRPGNREFNEGDEISRPQSGGGSGSGGGQASNGGTGEDDFIFTLDREEFFRFFFEDMELPNLVKTALCDITEFTRRRAGFTTSGVPVQLDLAHTMRKAKARKFALGSKKKKKLAELQSALELLLGDPAVKKDDERIALLLKEISELRSKIKNVRFLEEIDQVYRNHKLFPAPVSKAVVFCIMDVSGSMLQTHKDLAKRFFTLLYMFLFMNYEQIAIVYIRHHTTAKEVDHDEFFSSKETGGTIVSTALELALEIWKERYSNDYNVYIAQASDGDNLQKDNAECEQLLRDEIMPKVAYFVYVELVATLPQNMWKMFVEIQKDFPDSLGVQRILEPANVYPALRKLFEKKSA